MAVYCRQICFYNVDKSEMHSKVWAFKGFRTEKSLNFNDLNNKEMSDLDCGKDKASLGEHLKPSPTPMSLTYSVSPCFAAVVEKSHIRQAVTVIDMATSL